MQMMLPIRDGGAWRAAVYGVTRSRTWLKWLSSIRDLFPKYTNSSYSLISKQTNNPIKNWAEDQNRYFFKGDKQMANSHLKRCLTSLLMREMQIKTTKMYHLTLVRMTTIKTSTNNKCLRGCGENRTLLHCSKEHKLVLPLWRLAWRFHKELKIQLSHEPAIPILGIYPERMKTNSKWHMHPNVVSSTIYTRQNMAAT